MEREKKVQKRRFCFFCSGKSGTCDLLFSGHLYASSIDSAYAAVAGELIKRGNFDLDSLSIEVTAGFKECNKREI